MPQESNITELIKNLIPTENNIGTGEVTKVLGNNYFEVALDNATQRVRSGIQEKIYLGDTATVIYNGKNLEISRRVGATGQERKVYNVIG